MKTRKIILLAAMPFVVGTLAAEEVVEEPNKSIVIDTGWQESQPDDARHKTHYPACVEIMPIEGDGIKYRVIFIQNPTDDFDCKYAVGIAAGEYEHLNAVLIDQGYTQISHQVATVKSGIVHSAVWVNSKKIENKSEQATPRKPSD